MWPVYSVCAIVIQTKSGCNYIISNYCSRGCSLHWYPCRERQLRTTLTHSHQQITSRTQSFMTGLTGLLIRQKSILDDSMLMDVLIGLLFLFEFLKRVMHIKEPQFAFVGLPVSWEIRETTRDSTGLGWVTSTPGENGHDIDSCDSSVPGLSSQIQPVTLVNCYDTWLDLHRSTLRFIVCLFYLDECLRDGIGDIRRSFLKMTKAFLEIGGKHLSWNFSPCKIHAFRNLERFRQVSNLDFFYWKKYPPSQTCPFRHIFRPTAVGWDKDFVPRWSAKFGGFFQML